MFESGVKALILLCLGVLLVFLAIWVLGELGLVLPGTVLNILKVIGILIVLLVIYRTVKPHVGGW